MKKAKAKYGFQGKIKGVIALIRILTNSTEKAAESFIRDAAEVNDLIFSLPATGYGRRKSKKVDPRWATGAILLAGYIGNIVEVDETAASLQGTPIKVFSLVKGTPVQKRTDGSGYRGLASAKLCVELEKDSGEKVLIDISSQFRREVGRINDVRVGALAKSMPQSINLKDINALRGWFSNAGLKK